MEDKPTSPVDNPIPASGEIETNVDRDVVAYDTHRRLLGEKKKVQAQLEKAEAQNQDYLMAKNIDEGKKDEVIKLWQERAVSAEKNLKEKEENDHWNKLNVSVERVASKHGCVIPQDFIKLIGDDIDAISYDGSNVDESSIEYIIEKHKKVNPRLFHSKEVRFSDGSPQTQFRQTEKPRNEMSMAELEAAYKRQKGL